MQTMSKVSDTVPGDFRSDEGSDSSDVENNVSQAMDYRLDSSLSLTMPMPGTGAPHSYMGVKQESDESDGGEGLSPYPRDDSKADSTGDDLDQQQFDRKGSYTYLFCLSIIKL